jgi:hypothetical protein
MARASRRCRESPGTQYAGRAAPARKREECGRHEVDGLPDHDLRLGVVLLVDPDEQAGAGLLGVLDVAADSVRWIRFLVIGSRPA